MGKDERWAHGFISMQEHEYEAASPLAKPKAWLSMKRIDSD
jgi:hypothetical protein